MKLRATKSGRIAKTPEYSDPGVSEEGGNALCPSNACCIVSDIDSPASRNVFYIEERAIDLCSTAAVG
jgi:hypothetical protein